MENFASNTQVHGHSLRWIAVIFFVILSLEVFSQPNLSTTHKKAGKLYFKADKKYRERDFQTSIDLLRQATALDHSFYEAYLRKGSLFTALGEEDSAYVNFTSYYQYSPDPSASVLERIAHMAFDRGAYERSQEYLTAFLLRVPEKATDREIDLLKRSIPFAQAQIRNGDLLEIETLPDEINRYGLQYLPALTVDEKTLVYTKRDIFSDDEDIVISYFENGRWGASNSVSERINTSLNEGAATISADGRSMIFTACDRRGSYGSCDLYISRKSGDRWSKPKNLGSTVNSKYWESQPSLSADGKTLYFASNRPGGFGGRDIWRAEFANGSWSVPQNLGRQVNSFKDETTPFVHFNGQTLYFSSNSYPGLGGFDLFKVERKDTVWSVVENLGYPINTHRDEVALMVNANGKRGYFAKELRKNREILDSKIVSFDLPEDKIPRQSYYLSGRISDKETGAPLRASLQIVDITNNKKVYDNHSDSISGEYYLVLPSRTELAGYVKKKGYLYQTISFTDSATYDVNIDTFDIEMTPVVEGERLVLKNIYFETNSYELDERSDSELTSVADFLSENPEVSIEISGHTDDIGDKEYNQKLSEQRALSVYNALRGNGVEAKRLQFSGYGDSRPLKPNNSAINRQSNRRIEFRVLRSKH